MAHICIKPTQVPLQGHLGAHDRIGGIRHPGQVLKKPYLCNIYLRVNAPPIYTACVYKIDGCIKLPSIYYKTLQPICCLCIKPSYLPLQYGFYARSALRPPHAAPLQQPTPAERRTAGQVLKPPCLHCMCVLKPLLSTLYICIKPPLSMSHLPIKPSYLHWAAGCSCSRACQWCPTASYTWARSGALWST
jgi:hypothetical protein